MNLHFFGNHVTLPPPPRVKQEHPHDSSGPLSSLVASIPRLFGSHAAHTHPAASPKQASNAMCSPTRSSTHHASLKELGLPRRPSFDEFDSFHMHSPRPHEPPSGYR
eukprot:CAMPEP_0173388602 /NCGR_PEP_ID=MMETSP1356-20130122/10876_1 /TAXON_ID=77927 ORGANISM="Hemiselmis virescens, Strain PCC157" /NCGR_SAMPLE_ID=MMETSP1356 /ASSEMBLY_ACC=CAM_ASM_000847 /LENGTH=106 /DNA_ID=CAMNT_0014345551 /DNA_START=21 /DNA_END=341 /DNA_ORIENTATION=-